ncbi:PxKF domain-containing protein [Knoellia locipacati]|uniref:OmpL47-type beta-barrel domain-containing protein n=1 Tax=Knoellia locipacati TaxID=882824 RepID=UPI00384F9DEB
MQLRQNAAADARHRRLVDAGPSRTTRRLLAVVAASSIVVLGGVGLTPAQASSVTSAVFSGTTGTVAVGGTLYAKQGAALTLTVVTSSDTKCVEVAGAASLPRQTSATPKSSWTFTTTAPAGDGSQAFTVAASPNFNANNCTGQTNSTQASYVRDNTGPAVAAEMAPAANAAGWNNSEVTVKWSASDTGVGVAAAQPFRTDSVTANGVQVLTAPAQGDRLGNLGAGGSTTVRVDKATPTITAGQTKNADGTTTVTFTCGDSLSGIASCVADGSTTNSRIVQPGATVTGTATDQAGNSSTASSTAPAADTTAPLLSGAPTTLPNGAGWYRGDVTIDWTASDPESGVPTAPADTVIGGEGTGLTSNATVTNGAGLSTTAGSSPAVRIDRTAPSTSISGASNAWVNDAVTLTLTRSDNLSQVASTSYTVDGGSTTSGTSVLLETTGEHTITYWSTDNAGNVEVPKTATVRIDRTAPSISHSFTPSSYTDGAWTNGDVTVRFICDDQGGSGLVGCTEPVTESGEGIRTVTGEATDGAGNATPDAATVRIDKTLPTITATAVGEKNAAGWYKADVRVEYVVSDNLSGVATPPKADVLSEGSDQSASALVTDAAGNAAEAGVTDIDVDKTPPTLVGSFPSGWHTEDVTVTWTCTDALSGPAGTPAATTVTGEGANLSATASCSDVAGNATTKTVTGIMIDRSRPTTEAEVSGSPTNDWYAQGATVTLTGSDNLSGVAATFFTLDGGPATQYEKPLELTEDGTHTVTFWSTDGAGNFEAAGAPVVVRVDGTAPVTSVVNPISPDSGWFVTSGIPFAFSTTESGSGTHATYYTIDGGPAQTYGQPFTQDLSDGVHQVTYWSTDVAGNVEAERDFELNVDTVAPTIEGATLNADGGRRPANAFGWFNSPVDVRFSCADTGSGLQVGVAGCAGDTTLTNDGAGQTATGDAVDVAGNRSRTTFGPVNLDQVKPTLAGVPIAANAAGWHKGDVTVTWVGDDGLSGLDPATQPEPSTITGEGADLGAGPVTVKDKAGNTSELTSVTGVRIDRTPPVVKGAAKTAPNAAGWYSGDVVVDFTCTDALSGVATCPTSALLKGNGADQSVTSGVATDRAGNEGTGATVRNINIDGLAPTTTSNNTCTAVNEWCKGDNADVVLTATDQTGLSGVKELRYRVDGGDEQVAAGSNTTVSVPLSGTGAGTVKYWAVDRAGNVEPANTVALRWDNIAPTVSNTLSPAPNADKWNRSDVTVTFSAKDDDKGSGVASVTAPVTVSTETSGRVVTGTAKDVVGNIGTDSVTVLLDKSQPTISGSVTSGTKTASGWYSGPVTVTFTCADALSGVATCPDPVVLTANGTNSATGTVTDRAGNTATASVGGIRIDQEKPALTTADVNVAGATFTLGQVPAASCAAKDDFAGLASCVVTVTGGNASGVGTFFYTATATDLVGNTSTVTGTFRVVYRFDGFLQPINDTAHQVGTSTSVFKAGSMVPAKLQLKKADGTVVQATTAPVWLTPVKGSSMIAPVDESVYSASSDSGTTYRYDATTGQYQYNWKTGSAGGSYWRVGVKLDDGQTHLVNIGTR